MESSQPSAPPYAPLSPNSMHRHPEALSCNVDVNTARPAEQTSVPAGASRNRCKDKAEAATTRQAPPAAEAAAAAAAGDDEDMEQQQQQQQQRASSVWTLLLAQCKRFDMELAAIFLAGILVTTACAIFTKDEGWFRFEAPQPGLTEESAGVGAIVVFNIGLSTYTAQAHSAGDPALVYYTNRGELREASGSAAQIAYALYAFLVLSLISAAGTLWYLALFHEYLQGRQVINKGRERAVGCLGLLATGLGVGLLGLGTAAFREACAEAFIRRPYTNIDGSLLNGVDTAGRRLVSEYAYHLTGLTWFLWLLVGGILLSHSCCRANKRRATRHEGDLEAGVGAHV